MDTSPEMHRLIVKLAREKSPEWRLRKTFELCEEVRLLRLAGKKWREEKG